MTPKEKAKQLYDRYCNMSSYCDDANECALITVNEIIHNNNEINGPGDGWIYVEENTDYWKQVKEEIQKL